MVLSRNELIEALSKRDLMIEPFDESRLTPNGYYLTAGKISVPKVHWTVREGFIAVGKRTRFVVRTTEHVRLGRGLTGTLSLAPDLSSKGVLASFARLDAGFDGRLTLSAFNTSIRTIDVAKGDPFVELVLEKVTGDDDTRGVAPAPRPVPTRTGVGAARDTTSGIRLDPRDSGHPCLELGCSVCCHGTEMPLTEQDRDRLEDLGHDGFYVVDDGWLTLANVSGRCYFLKEGRCSVYKDRPTGCTFYPAVFSADTEGVILDEDCPHGEEFGTTGTLLRDLKVLVDTVKRERGQRRLRKGF